MYDPDGDPIGPSANLYDSVILTKDEVCRLTVTNENSYDSAVLTKDTGVIRSLPIDADQYLDVSSKPIKAGLNIGHSINLAIDNIDGPCN